MFFCEFSVWMCWRFFNDFFVSRACIVIGGVWFGNLVCELNLFIVSDVLVVVFFMILCDEWCVVKNVFVLDLCMINFFFVFTFLIFSVFVFLSVFFDCMLFLCVFLMFCCFKLFGFIVFWLVMDLFDLLEMFFFYCVCFREFSSCSSSFTSARGDVIGEWNLFLVLFVLWII